MRKIYLDSSAYVKFFKTELGSASVKKIIELAEKGKVRVYISMWTLNESIAAIDKCHYQKHLIKTEGRKNRIIATILQETSKFGKSSNIEFVPLHLDIVKESHVLIVSLHISADDALQVHTAYTQGCEYLVCRDKCLIRKARDRIPNLTMLDVSRRSETTNLLNLT